MLNKELTIKIINISAELEVCINEAIDSMDAEELLEIGKLTLGENHNKVIELKNLLDELEQDSVYIDSIPQNE